MNGQQNIKNSYPGRNEGVALLVMLLAITLAVSTALISSLAQSNPEVARQKKTLETLAQAKQALIAWAVLQGDIGTDSYRRPGTLPCPDTNFFGTADSGNASGSCSSGGGTSIGRFPWKSLGIEMPSDATGEPLWYAVSDNFRRPGLTNAAINSNSAGNLKLYAANGTTLMTPEGEELAAIIIAPNSPLAGQNRTTAPNTASSYLDGFNGKNNASASGPFIAGPARDSQGNAVVNDLVIGISARELIAAIEKRALAEARNALAAHALANSGKYPNPAAVNGGNCVSTIADVRVSPVLPCASDVSTCFGRLPEDTLSTYAAPWFTQNGWGRTLVFAVNANDALDGSGANCRLTVTVDGASRRYVLVAPGSARAGQTRPSTTLSHYLEDPSNVDAWSGDPAFSAPGTNSNDQMLSQP